jgi:hypothetical protein
MSKLLDQIEQNVIKQSQFKTMSSSSSSSSGGIGFPGLLTVLFIGLKLTGHITWPWIWVLSPIWISALIGIAILTILLIVAIVAGVFK